MSPPWLESFLRQAHARRALFLGPSRVQGSDRDCGVLLPGWSLDSHAFVLVTINPPEVLLGLSVSQQPLSARLVQRRVRRVPQRRDGESEGLPPPRRFFFVSPGVRTPQCWTSRQPRTPRFVSQPREISRRADELPLSAWFSAWFLGRQGQLRAHRVPTTGRPVGLSSVRGPPLRASGPAAPAASAALPCLETDVSCILSHLPFRQETRRQGRHEAMPASTPLVAAEMAETDRPREVQSW